MVLSRPIFRTGIAFACQLISGGAWALIDPAFLTRNAYWLIAAGLALLVFVYLWDEVGAFIRHKQVQFKAPDAPNARVIAQGARSVAAGGDINAPVHTGDIIGKVPFVLTEDAKRETLERVLPAKQIKLVTVGDQQMGDELASYLEANGITIKRRIATGQYGANLEIQGPITVIQFPGMAQVVLDPSK